MEMKIERGFLKNKEKEGENGYNNYL